jgi:phosphoribosylpyrophosphate synthetase
VYTEIHKHIGCIIITLLIHTLLDSLANLINADNIVGKNVLIVDDICSRGGTFYHSAKALKEAGAANISLYITHCENTILEGEIFTSGLIQRVYTTDSLEHCDELKEKLHYV